MRTFTLQSDTSDKFWSIDVVGTSVTVHFGRTGTKGQTKTQTFGAPDDATTHARKLVAAKVGKGYTETEAAGTGLTPVAPVTRAPATTADVTTATPAATVTVEATTAAATTAPEPAEPAGPVPIGDLGLRLFRLEEAALAWGRPFEDTPGAGAAFTAKAAAAWVKSHFLMENTWGSGLTMIELPFDHLPTGEEANWWRAWLRTDEVMLTKWEHYSASVAQRLSALPKVLAGESFTPKKFEVEHPGFLQLPLALADTAPVDLLRAALQGKVHAAQVPALRALVLPRLTEAERTQLRELEDATPQDPLDRAVRSALLNSPAEHLALVESLPDDLFVERSTSSRLHFRWDAAIAVLIALPDTTDAVRVWDRLGHRRHQHDYCNLQLDRYGLLLAALGPDGLADLTDFLCAADNRDNADLRATTLAIRLHGPAAAGAFARAARESKAPDIAVQWLLGHPEATLDGHYVAKDRGILATVLRGLAGADAGVLDREVTDPQLTAVLTEIREQAGVPELTVGDEPPWWVEAVAAEAAAPVPDPKAEGAIAVPAKLPAFADPTLLPPVVFEGVRWRPDMLQQVLWSAARGTNDQTLTPRPLVAAVRDRLSARHRDALAVAVFDGWLGAGAPSPGRAFFLAAGYLGSDGFVQHLLPMVREWPGQSQHQRAVFGLRVLAATGTKTALQGISGLSAKSKFKGIQEAAQRSMATLAALQGLSPEQLADRVVPDGGLDTRGQRELSYGPRSFRVTLSPQGKLVIRDLDAEGKPVGKARTALPAPNSKDDADLAATTKAEFTVLRKQLTDLAKIQTVRLEQALVTGRRWTGQEHRDLIAAHPVLASLVQPLVWRVDAGDQRHLVRIAEVGEYLTLDEDVLDVADDDVVTLAHPLHLSADEISSWHQHLADYDLVAPIQQLDRPTFTLPAGTGIDLPAAALPQGTINPAGLVSMMERMGWRRSIPADAGVVHHLWIAFPVIDRAVVLTVSEGLWTGYLSESGDQRIEAAHVTTPAIAADTWYFDAKRDGLPWTDLSDVATSEALRGLAAIADKMAG